jgi:hypothetical protein
LVIQVPDWRKEHLGMEHPDTCGDGQSGGHLNNSLGEPKEAKELHIQVLDW